MHLERLLRLIQRPDIDLQGHTDLTLRVTGTAEDPQVSARIAAQGLAYGEWDLDRVEGEMDYVGRRASVGLRAWRGPRQVLNSFGTIPVDLSLTEVEDRIPSDQELALDIVADSLPAAFAVTSFVDLTDVDGTVGGDFRIAAG